MLSNAVPSKVAVANGKPTLVGLMQMPLSIPQWLNRDLAYTGVPYPSSEQDLLAPATALYYGAAYLDFLSRTLSKNHPEVSEELLVRHYRGGPQADISSPPLNVFWQQYCKEKRRVLPLLARITATIDHALAATVAQVDRHLNGPDKHAEANNSHGGSGGSQIHDLNRARAGGAYGAATAASSGGDGGGAGEALSHERTAGLVASVLQQHFVGEGIDPLMVRAIIEMESQRRGTRRAGSGGWGHTTGLGLMGVGLTTAQYLARQSRYSAHGVPREEDLYDPTKGIYFGIAYLHSLARYDGRRQADAFVVKAYRAGPEGTESEAASSYWRRYQEVRHWLSTQAGGTADMPSAAPRQSIAQMAHMSSPGVQVSSSGRVAVDRAGRAGVGNSSDLYQANQLTASTPAAERAVLSSAEIKALAESTNARHFKHCLSSRMLRAICVIESGGDPQAYRWEPGIGEASAGLMQTLLSTAQWLAKDMGYNAFGIPTINDLYRPAVSMYMGASYVHYLSGINGHTGSEEFVVRGYNGGPNGYKNKSTMDYWKKYLRVKSSLAD
eukprot:jgi/Mesvir1/17227/Mv07641-RA.1